MATLRFEVIGEAFKKRPLEVEAPAERPSEYFAINVFNKEKMARYLGFKVLLCDPPRAAAEGDEKFCSLDHLLVNSQIVTMHVPLNETTRNRT